jgi:hypothetical protein
VTGRVSAFAAPVTKQSTVVAGIVKTMAGDVQGDTTDLAEQHASQKKKSYGSVFSGEHGQRLNRPPINW